MSEDKIFYLLKKLRLQFYFNCNYFSHYRFIRRVKKSATIEIRRPERNGN